MREDNEDGPLGGHVALLVNAAEEQCLPFARLLQGRRAEMLVCHPDPKQAAAFTVTLLDDGAEAASQRLDPGALQDWRDALERARTAFGSADLCIVMDTPVGLAGARHADLLAGFRLFLGGAWRTSKRHALIMIGGADDPTEALDHLLSELRSSALPSNATLEVFAHGDPEALQALRRFLDST